MMITSLFLDAKPLLIQLIISLASCYHMALFINFYWTSLLQNIRHFYMCCFYYSFSILYPVLLVWIQLQSFFIPIKLNFNHIKAIVLRFMWFCSSFILSFFLRSTCNMHKWSHWIHILYIWIIVPLEPLGFKLMGISKAWPFIWYILPVKISEKSRQEGSYTHTHQGFLATFFLRKHRHLPDYNYRLSSLAGC